MGRFFVGSRAGEDAKYRQKEASVANSLKAPPEFDTLSIQNQSEIPLDWLTTRINSLFLRHLHFEDDITAGMVAESIRREEDAKNILVTVTALSHSQEAAFKVMQELWRSLLEAPRVSVKKESKIVDEIGVLRRRLENDLQEKKTRVTVSTVSRPPRRSRSPRSRPPRRSRSSRSRPPRSRSPIKHQPTPTSWEQKMREKAWEAASLSRLKK